MYHSMGNRDNFRPASERVDLVQDSANDLLGGHAGLCVNRHAYAPVRHDYFRQIRMFPGTAWRRSGAPGRPGVHSPAGRRSKAPRRAGADIARALPVGWLRLVTAGVCGVVRPGRLASAGQRSLRSAGDLCVAGYREAGGRVFRGGPGGSARSGQCQSRRGGQAVPCAGRPFTARDTGLRRRGVSCGRIANGGPGTTSA